MPFHPSLFAISLLKKIRPLGMFTFRAWVSLNQARKTPPHRFLIRLADALEQPLPFFTVLDGRLPMLVIWRDYVGMKIHKRGLYEAETVTLVKTILRRGDTFMDIGAHFGQYTLIASRSVEENGAVYSFEPHPETVQYLRQNVRINGCANVRIINAAVSDKTGEQTFHLGSRSNYGASSLVSSIEDSGKTAQTRVIKLDDYIKEQNIGAVTLIKADVEGAELNLLRGAEDLLSRKDKPMLILEFNEYTQSRFGQTCHNLAEWLRAHGYRLFRVGPKHGLGEYAVNGIDSYFNVFCIPAEKMNFLTEINALIAPEHENHLL